MSTHKASRHHHKHHHHTRHHKRDWRDTVVKYRFAIFISLGVVIGLLALTIGSFIAWSAYQGHLYQSVYGPELEAELGFTIDSPWVQAGDAKVEVSTIHPEPNGYMDKIGFRDGSIITNHSATEFYKLLYTQRGRTVSVDMVDGGDGVSIEARKVKTIRFLVPPKP